MGKGNWRQFVGRECGEAFLMRRWGGMETGTYGSSSYSQALQKPGMFGLGIWGLMSVFCGAVVGDSNTYGYTAKEREDDDQWRIQQHCNECARRQS